MINASNLPALFADCETPEADGVIQILVPAETEEDEPTILLRRVGSADGFWRLTPDPDLFHVHPADFDAIAEATPAVSPEGALVIGGQPKQIAGSVDGNGKRWLLIADPE